MHFQVKPMQERAAPKEGFIYTQMYYIHYSNINNKKIILKFFTYKIKNYMMFLNLYILGYIMYKV